MNFTLIPDEPNAILWQDEQGNSGVSSEGTPGWDRYQAWLTAGNLPDSMAIADELTLEELRERALAAINVAADEALVPITSRYPRGEIDSWPEQCLEASAWLADGKAPTPLLNAITGAVSSAAKKDFCLGILAKAQGYKGAVGTVIAWRRACTAWVEQRTERDHLVVFLPIFPEVPDAP